MHGLIFRSFESFVRNTYGDKLWAAIIIETNPGFDTFEPMFHYDAQLLQDIVGVAALRLDRAKGIIFEDWGTYLVAHPKSERLRRLLRFGGVDYEDFLLSLEDLPGRARLAISDMELPGLEIFDRGDGIYALDLIHDIPGVGHLFLGLLRALADDYGALVLIDFEGRSKGVDRLVIQLLEAEFSEGRGFHLAQSAAG